MPYIYFTFTMTVIIGEESALFWWNLFVFCSSSRLNTTISRSAQIFLDFGKILELWTSPWRQVVKTSSQCVWIGLQRDLLARLMTCYHWLIFKSFQQTGMVWPSCLTKQPRVKLYLRVKKDHRDKANLRRVWFTVISFHVQIVPSQIVPLHSQIVSQKNQFVPHI